MADDQNEFHTVRGYELIDHSGSSLSPSMEDYLEMIYRQAVPKGYTRISDLAGALNVQPPSASKMVQKLADLNYLLYQKYGIIELSESGRLLGEYLLYRHEITRRFLQLLGVGENILKETEKLEHNLSRDTVNRVSCLLGFLDESPDIRIQFNKYLQKCTAVPSGEEL